MCGQPILEPVHMEGFHGQLKSWQPLHERCAEVLGEIARRTGQNGPVLRDGFAGDAGSARKMI
jgi:hypothetical protein